MAGTGTHCLTTGDDGTAISIGFEFKFDKDKGACSLAPGIMDEAWEASPDYSGEGSA